MTDHAEIAVTEMKENEAKVKFIRGAYPHVEWPDISAERMWRGTTAKTRIEGYRDLVNMDGGTHYAFVTDLYKVVPHEVVLHNMLDVIDGMPEFGEPNVIIALASGGGKARFDVNFPEVQHTIARINNGSTEIPGIGDVVNMKVTGLTSYDTGWSQRAVLGALRLVCTNGLTVGKEFARFAGRHILSLDQDKFRKTLRVGMEKFSEQTELWKAWAGKTLTGDEYEESWEVLPFSEKQREKIQELPEEASKRPLLDYIPKSVNQWFFYSVLTQFVTHEMASVVTRTNIEPKIAEVFHNM